MSTTEVGLLAFAVFMYFVGVYVGGLDSSDDKQSAEMLKPIEGEIKVYHAIDSLDGRESLFVVTDNHVNVTIYGGPNDPLFQFNYDTLRDGFSEKSRSGLQRLDDMVNPTLVRVVTPN